jgi:hypothetical protein
VITRSDASDRAALANRLDRIHVVGQHRAGTHRGHGRRKGEALGVRGPVVVPHAQRTVGDQIAGVEPRAVLAVHDPAGRQA